MKDETQLDNIEDDENCVNIETSEFEQIVGRLDKIEGKLDNLDDEIHKGDEAVREYVDSKISEHRKSVQDDMTKLASNFEQTARNLINELVAPITTQVTQFMERVNHNVEELNEVKAGLEETKKQFTLFNNQFNAERADRMNDYTLLSTAILGDEMGVGQGLIGIVANTDKKLDKLEETISEFLSKQKKVNEKVEAHQRVLDIPKNINWKFVVRWGVLASGLSGGGLYTVLEAFNII